MDLDFSEPGVGPIEMSKALLVGGLVLLLVHPIALAQSSDPGSMSQSDSAGSPSRAQSDASDIPSSPYSAFEQGHYDAAAEAFAKKVAKRPENPSANLNLGSALHQLKDYDGARSAFERALSTEDRRLKAKALYDLGNTAYRQGRLEEAIERYEEALSLDADDEDSKHNLEFVRRELERRQQQSQQRQQSQDQSESDEQQQQDQQDQEEQQGQQGKSEQQEDGDDGDGSDQQQGENQQQQDSDSDGLSDQQERQAENPTDPQNPDTDGDGRSDGEEDQNRNGRVDEGETDPTKPDSPDGDQAQTESEPEGSEDEQGNPQEGQQGPQGQPLSLSPEEAQRLLAALEDKRPPSARDGKPGQKTKKAKDW